MRPVMDRRAPGQGRIPGPQEGRRRDPAPSRLSYRLQRLMLTPGFRGFVRFGLPLAVVAGLVVFGFTDEKVRTFVDHSITEARTKLEARPEFQVKLMAVDGASVEVSEDIRDVLALDLPASSFDLDLEKMRETVLSLDAVEDASLRIRSGGILQVEIEERRPVVVWRGPHGIEMLSADGKRVGPLIARAARPDLPLVTGAGANKVIPQALALFEVATPLAERLRGLVRVGERRWDLVLDRDQKIMLPEARPVDALERVIALDNAQDLLSRDVVAVDLRNENRPIIRLAASGAAELRRIRGY